MSLLSCSLRKGGVSFVACGTRPKAECSAQVLSSLAPAAENQAAERGQSEVQVYRFPNALCSDGGRRINNAEPDWHESLEGRPKFGYEFWHDHLRPLGFGLKAEVLEYPGGKPGDIGFFLTWK